MAQERRRAVIDRIEDGKFAVLLVEDDTELVVPVEELPEGAEGGTWLEFDVEGGRMVDPRIDETATKEVSERIRSKLDQLRARGTRRDKKGSGS